MDNQEDIIRIIQSLIGTNDTLIGFKIIVMANNSLNNKPYKRTLIYNWAEGGKENIIEEIK